MNQYNSVCVTCQIKFYKKPYEKKRTKNDFCSSKCLAIYNNKYKLNNNNRRKKEGKCKICQTVISKSRVYCTICNPRKKRNNNLTIKDVIFNGIKSSKYSYIRYKARQYAFHVLKWNKCAICKYNKHIEICHIVPISLFSQDTLLSVVNHYSNLIALCPNHHWEFDKKFKTRPLCSSLI